MFEKFPKVVSLLVCVGIVACVPPPQEIELATKFDPEHAKKLLEPGASTIQGSGLIRQRGGGVVTCAGRNVVLIPATSYAEERMGATFGNTYRGFVESGPDFSSTPQQYVELQRVGVCDAQGFFKFDNVSDGRFYVFTFISWEVPTRYGTSIQGGNLMQLVEVKDGETKDLVLSP